MIARWLSDDPDLWSWVYGVLHDQRISDEPTPDFLRLLAEAAVRADGPSYAALRPALLVVSAMFHDYLCCCYCAGDEDEVLPRDLEEKMLALIFRDESLLTTTEIDEAFVFTIEPHRDIWRSMVRLRKCGLAIDRAAVEKDFRDRGLDAGLVFVRDFEPDDDLHHPHMQSVVAGVQRFFAENVEAMRRKALASIAAIASDEDLIPLASKVTQ